MASVWAFRRPETEPITAEGVSWTVCCMAANISVCVLGWWRCFANNYLHWAAMCTWLLLNAQGNIIFYLD